MEFKVQSIVPNETITVTSDTKNDTPAVLIQSDDPEYCTQIWLTPEQAQRLAVALEAFSVMVGRGALS